MPHSDPSLALLAAQLAMTRVLAEASSLKQALPERRAVCDTTGWEWAALWEPDPAANELRCELIWHEPQAELPEFEALSRATPLPRGVGLPGRVWESNQPAWIVDVSEEANFPRRVAARAAGLHGAFAFPVIRAGQVLAVMEFFAHDVREPDSRLLALMAVTGEQIGQFIHRRRAEDALGQSEARNTAVLETALDCIVFMDHRGMVMEWNPAAERTFGYLREQAVGKEMADLIIPASLREAHRSGLSRYLKTGIGPVIGKRIEITAVRATGEEFHVELAITRVPGSHPPLFTGYLRDITERKGAEQERSQLLSAERDARGEAEAANVLKDEFLATVSHELRTPLTAILGWTQLLHPGAQCDPEVKHGLEIIERNARAMAQLVEDVLDVSRIIRGKLRLEVRPVDLPAVIDAALATVRPAAEAKEIRLEAALNPFAGHVYGDAGRMQQVAWNLLSNAIKFTPKGGKVQVRLERINSHVELTVSDSGEGIDPEFLPHIFQRFRQADASTRRAHTGLGLGLAIARHLVELQGGRIRAHSDGPGKGSTFIVHLPIAAHSEAPHPQRVHSGGAREESSGEGARQDLKGIRVLVVDDERDARQLLGAILAGSGAEVRTAASARDALEALPQFRPHVLLSDIGMPEQDGYDLIREVRRLPADQGGSIPAAALTAFARPQDRRQALMEGFQMHIPKPVESADLIAAVASLAGRVR